MVKDPEYNVVCCTDDNYAECCGVLLCSLLENHKKKKFLIHILSESLSDNVRSMIISLVHSYGSKVRFYDVDISKLEGVRFRKKNPLSMAAYYRILLSTTLDESIKKVLYLDCDIVIVGDIVPLFELDLTGYALAAVQDCVTIPSNDLHRLQLNFSYDDKYFNSGVLMLNLEYWRDNNIEPLMLDFAKRDREVFYHDQDALNYVFKRKWFQLSPKWNRMNMVSIDSLTFNNRSDKREFIQDLRILHYASTQAFKPWTEIKGIPYKKYYNKFKALTPWKDTPPLLVKGKAKVYGILLLYYINNFILRAPYIFSIPFLILRDIAYFIHCCFKKVPYIKY